ncbi:hypothetical protein [Methanoregula sp.]|uniref:hypothetical protein n=1 Tax=Methanoregula sp. TaxID=2052170 RepID=UPI003BD44174
MVLKALEKSPNLILSLWTSGLLVLLMESNCPENPQRYNILIPFLTAYVNLIKIEEVKAYHPVVISASHIWKKIFSLQ